MNTKLTSITITGIFLRIIRKIFFLRFISLKVMRYIVARKITSNRLNKFYNKLNFDEKSVFHTIFYKTFRKGQKIEKDGYWEFIFSGKIIKLPLRKNMTWLDWEIIISILGHNIEIKETYLSLICSDHPPKVFFDIGANYGLHSLLFLSQNIHTISFEPNPQCKIEFDEYCKLNRFEGKMEMVAVGEKDGVAELCFPEKETWLGTIDDNTKKKDYLLNKELKSIIVPLITLDSYVSKHQIYPDIIKIDAEGYELKVIAGAKQTINLVKPLIIFECNVLNDKKEIWDEFMKMKYIISELPIVNNEKPIILSLPHFISSPHVNFVAIPEYHWLLTGI